MSDNNNRSSIKEYIKYFRVWFIILLVLAVVAGVLWVARRGNSISFYESTNTQRVYGNQRVFDYGDQLTDYEEEQLEAYIHEAEKKTLTDIVIVTLNQSLKDYEPEYRSRYSMTITPDRYVMVFADKFWEDNKFGYDCPQVLDGTVTTGDGVLLVDNVYREDETGKIYTWMCTTGNAETAYSSSMIDHALDKFYDEVEYDYYSACISFVDCIVRDMGPKDYSSAGWPYVVGLLILIIFYFANSKEKAGRVTVKADTYIPAGTLKFPVREDTFLRKTVTKVYNPPSSSGGGGGGGHHSSGGGGSHGGGGHSR